jgi:GDP-L-fucose synthase
MRLLVTGARGRLGHEVIQTLIKHPTIKEVFDPSRQDLNLEDSLNVEEYFASIQPTHVIHLAGYVYGIGGHHKRPLDSLKTAQIDLNLFNAIAKNPPQWIFYASSVAAYDPKVQALPLDESKFLLGEPSDAESLYANVKKFAFTYLLNLKSSLGISFSYGLLTNLFGAQEKLLSEERHAIEALIDKALKARETNSVLEVWGNPDDSRDFVSYSHAASVILNLLDLQTGPINIASGTEISLSQLIQVFSESFGANFNARYIPGPSSISRRVSSVVKLNELVPFTASYNPVVELKEYISSRALSGI